jgi:hypothetical protein
MVEKALRRSTERNIKNLLDGDVRMVTMKVNHVVVAQLPPEQSTNLPLAPVAVK